MDMKQNTVIFEYNSLNEYDYSLDSYLEGILDGMKKLQQCTNPNIVLTVKDTPLFQLLNFPHLVRFKLYFWAKTYLNITEYKDQQFIHEFIVHAERVDNPRPGEHHGQSDTPPSGGASNEGTGTK